MARASLAQAGAELVQHGDERAARAFGVLHPAGHFRRDLTPPVRQPTEHFVEKCIKLRPEVRPGGIMHQSMVHEAAYLGGALVPAGQTGCQGRCHTDLSLAQQYAIIDGATGLVVG